MPQIIDGIESNTVNINRVWYVLSVITVVCGRVLQIFQNSRSLLQILGTRRTTYTEFRTENLQFWSDVLTSMLLVLPASCP